MALDTVNEVVASVPPVTVGGLVFAGMDLSQWVLILTAVYTSILIIKHGPGAVYDFYKGVQKLWLKVRRQNSK